MNFELRPRTLRMPVATWRAIVAVVAVLALATVSQSTLARGIPDSFADLAEELLPSVVNISTTQVLKGPLARNGLPFPQFPPGSPFEEFFKEFFDRNRGGGDGEDEAPAPKVTSLGSGFIIDESGLIVTNNHVIGEAEEIRVTLHDGTELEAEIVGRDREVDLALLRVKTDKPLKAVKFGDSDAARVGDWVIAIGNPYGLGGTVTAGIISARGRNINVGPYDNFIQVDAPINRGNSGGPLFNMNGEVIGINTAIYSPSGGSVGIGFAIPSAMAVKVIRDLRTYGEPRRGWLGVTIQTVTDEIAESLGLKEAKGALISNVVEGDPADKAGIKPGDVILKFNNQDVAGPRELQRIVADAPIKERVPVVVWRNGKTRKLYVTVGRKAVNAVAATAGTGRPDARPGEGQRTILGMKLAALDDSYRERLNLGEEVKGVVVLKVAGDSNAADVGLQRGDVITEAAGTPVTTPDEFEKQVAKARAAKRKSILLRINRGGTPLYIAVRIKAKKG